MQNSYWHKQSRNQPLFPDLIWSRPERRSSAGKLVIVGGNLHGFAAAAEAYQIAVAAGIGTARVILPDSLEKTVGRIFEAGEYAPSTPSGSFAKASSGPILDLLKWGDAGLLAGDLGRNSETAIVLEKLLDDYQGQLTITKDALDYFIESPFKLTSRPDTTLVLSFGQLQKLAQKTKFPRAITFSMDLVRFIETVHELQALVSPYLIVLHANQLIVAANGQISTTPHENNTDSWRVSVAASASVWWLQHKNKPFEALTSSLLGH